MNTRKLHPLLSLTLKASLVFLTIIGMVIPYHLAHAATLCVNETGSGGCYSSIQGAINAATNGDTINIAAGTYIENVVVNKSVTLAGAGIGNTIVLPATSSPGCAVQSSLCGGSASNVFLIQADNVVIHDLTADGDNPSLTSGIVRNGADLDARNGIIEDYYTGSWQGLTVYNVEVKNIYLRGIYPSTSDLSFSIHNNIVTNVAGEPASIGIFVWAGSGTIENNTVSYANDGIAANHSKGVQILNNTVTHSSSGIHTDNAGDSGGTADLIKGNTVDCTAVPGAYGIFVFVPYIAPTVEENAITHCSVGISAWGGQGVATTTQFTSNTITGDLSANSTGVYITTSIISWGYQDVAAVFSNNRITGFADGVLVEAGPDAGNPVAWSSQTITATFSQNQIEGNTEGMHTGTQGTYIVTAVKNWWGDETGPGTIGSGSGDTIGNGIPFSPWCTDAECSTLLVQASTPANNTVFAGNLRKLNVTFSKNVLHDGSINAANHTGNYLLFSEGANATFDTINCLGGIAGDDVAFSVDSITYDPGTFTATLNVNGGTPLPNGNYRLLACGTTSIFDLGGNELNDGIADSAIDFTVTSAPAALPATGFAPGRVTSLPPQETSYASTDMWLEIPALHVSATIVGVPRSEDSWDVAWLDESAGWLEGTAFPTWAGNTVLTAHVWNADNTPGPFLHIKDLRYGDQIEIHAWGQTYVYEVRANRTYWAGTPVSRVFQHADYDVVTLLTCEGFNPLADNYIFRRAVQAVLVDVK